MTTDRSTGIDPFTTKLATAVLEATFAADYATVYLLHFDQPYRHARHYTGWTCDLPGRLADHANGHGARLTQVVRAAGIGWSLARTWPGPRARERSLKRQGGASRRCPLCGTKPRTNHPPTSNPLDKRPGRTIR